jgi:uncharacterized membrane protein
MRQEGDIVVERKKKLSYMVQLSLLIAVELVMAFIPMLGYIQLPFIKATTLHIPVILGAILLGPLAGGILGGVMGLTSVINNTIAPVLTSFVFTPFYAPGQYTAGNLWSLVVAIVPRILIGVLAAWGYRGIFRLWKNRTVACAGAGLIGALTNTEFVMSFIALFFGESYAAARNLVGGSTIYWVIMASVAVQGPLEAAVAAVLVAVIGRVLLALQERTGPNL